MSSIRSELVKLLERLRVPTYLSFVDGYATGVVFVIYLLSLK